LVEAGCGDVITVNTAELHDGIGRKGQPRHWQILFLAPEVVAKYYDTPVAEIEFCNPVLRSENVLNLARAAISATYRDDIDSEETEQLIMVALGSLVGPVVCKRGLRDEKTSNEVQ